MRKGWLNISNSINVIHQIKRCKYKSHMTISVDIEKGFEKIPNPLMITPRNTDIEGPYLKPIKTIYDKPMAKIILNGKKLKSFPL